MSVSLFTRLQDGEFRRPKLRMREGKRPRRPKRWARIDTIVDVEDKIWLWGPTTTRRAAMGI
jgi:hypothetical protein